MNSRLHIPRLEQTAGRLLRVSDFLRSGEVPPVPTYFVPSQSPYQVTNFLYFAPTVFIDTNQWTPDGTDVGVPVHGLFEPREGAWSYVTPDTWIPPKFAARIPQYVMLTWNAQTFDEVPGDRPEVDAIQVAVRMVYGQVQDWLRSHRPGKTAVLISVQTGITMVPPQPNVFNDPGLGLFPVEPESFAIIRGSSQVVLIDDISGQFLGTNTFAVAVGTTEGALLIPPIGGHASGLFPPTVDRFASYKALVYDNPRSPDVTRESFDEALADLEAAGWGREAEYGGDPATISFANLLANIAAFFHFDPDTGLDLPLT